MKGKGKCFSATGPRVDMGCQNKRKKWDIQRKKGKAAAGKGGKHWVKKPLGLLACTFINKHELAGREILGGREAKAGKATTSSPSEEDKKAHHD